jgi:hypothetical protein
MGPGQRNVLISEHGEHVWALHGVAVCAVQAVLHRTCAPFFAQEGPNDQSRRRCPRLSPREHLSSTITLPRQPLRKPADGLPRVLSLSSCLCPPAPSLPLHARRAFAASGIASVE